MLIKLQQELFTLPTMLVFKLSWKLAVLCKGQNIRKTEANCGKLARRNIEITLLEVYFRI